MKVTIVNEYHRLALLYHSMGANVGALKRGSKCPIHKWKNLQHTRQTLDEINQLPWRSAAGVSYFPGVGGWHDFDRWITLHERALQ